MNISPTVIIPPLGVQLTAVSNFINIAQQQPKFDPAYLAYPWKEVEETVIQPNRMAALDSGIIEEQQQVPSSVEEVRSLSRGIFDPQINSFLEERLSEQRVMEEDLFIPRLERAIDHEIVSRKPAEAFIESLRVFNSDRDRYYKANLAARWFLPCGAAAIFVMHHFASQDGWTIEDIPVIALLSLPLVAGTASAALSMVFRKKIAPIYKT